MGTRDAEPSEWQTSRVIVLPSVVFAHLSAAALKLMLALVVWQPDTDWLLPVAAGAH